MTERLPSFYIIGAPKCGTTSLHSWLSGHPLVFAPHKETCFFSQDIFPTSHLITHIPSLESYCQIFDSKQSEQIGGEATPKYLYSDNALSEIVRIRPDARIIVCLRDPVELAISLHSQKLREGIEREVSFEKAWARSLDSLARADHNLSHEIHYYLWACLGSRLKVVYEKFPASAVLVLLTSELRVNPGECYVQILKFLGLRDDGRTDFTAHNERVHVRNMMLHRGLLGLKKLAGPVLQPLSDLRGGRGLGILKIANKFNAQPGRYSNQVPPEFRQKMYRELDGEIALAESFLGGRQLVPRGMP